MKFNTTNFNSNQAPAEFVKTAFARRTRSSAPPGLPVELEEHKPTFTPLVRGALQADEDERSGNTRAASVRLRALTRTRSAERAH